MSKLFWLVLLAISFGLLGPQVRATTSGTSTVKLDDIPVGKVIQIGELKFVKVNESQYMTTSPACIDELAVGNYKDFAYNGTTGNDGSEQTLNVCAGHTYQLEVWGAEGGYTDTGGATAHTAFGGYATGKYTPTTNQTLYINSGGQGLCAITDKAIAKGGYNGGGQSFGTSAGNPGCGGGGATHIASKSGLLYTLENYKNTILIVAGGGGGTGPDPMDRGGSGGGAQGGNGLGETCVGHGGTQTGLRNDGNCTTAGLVCFGRGNSSSIIGGAGGGGFYGGDNGASDGADAYQVANHSCTPVTTFNSHGGAPWSGGAGGGSGYLNSVLSESGFWCYTGCTGANTTVVAVTGNHVSKTANTGNGYARITRLN